MSMSSTSAWPVLRAHDRLAPPRRRRRAGLEREGSLSLVVHATIILLMIVVAVRRPPPRAQESAPIAVVFEGGSQPTPAAIPESLRSQPTTTPDVSQHEQVPPGAVPSRPSQASSQSAPQTPSEPETRPLPQPPKAALAAPATPRQARTVPRHAAPASPFAELSAPINLSLAGHPPPPASQGHLSRGINLALAPTAENASVLTRFPSARRQLGEDWWAAFSAYVEAHKYYPMSAAVHGEDGQSTLYLVIERDGTVKSVRVYRSSGSQTLDDAWVSEFRGQKVPPFPEGTAENEVSFPASMDYILLHR